MIAARLDAAFEDAFEDARGGGVLDHEQVLAIVRMEAERHLRKVQTLAALERSAPDHDPAEARQHDLLVAEVHELIAARGPNATVTAEDEARMRTHGLTDGAIEQVRLMLMHMRAQNLTAPSQRRVDGLLDNVGAKPTRPNRARAAEASLRGIAAANRHMAAQHAGIWDEDERIGTDVLKSVRSRAAGGLQPEDAERSEIGGTDRTFRTAPGPIVLRGPATIARPTGSSNAERECPVVDAHADDQRPGRGEDGGMRGSVPNSGSAAEPTIRPAFEAAFAFIQKRSRPSPSSTGAGGGTDEGHRAIPNGRRPRAQRSRGERNDKTARQIVSVGNLFLRLLEERDVHHPVDIVQADLVAYWELLGDLSVNYGKSPKDKRRSLSELRAIGAAKPNERGMSAGTVNRHLTQIKTLLTTLGALGHDVSDDLDPAALREHDPQQKIDRRKPFTQPQMRAVFGHPYYTNGPLAPDADDAVRKLVVTRHHDGVYWSFLLAYYTGARRNEFAALAVEDVLEHGTVGIHTSTNEGHADLIEQYGDDYDGPLLHIRRSEFGDVKTGPSVRAVPLHEELVRLGFLDYVRVIRALGYRLLFPDVDTKGATTTLGDQLYDRAIPLFNAAIPERRRLQAYHAIRHTTKHEFERAGISTAVIADVLGHKREGTTSEYGARSLDLMSDAIAKLPVLTGTLNPSPIRTHNWVSRRARPPQWRRRKEGPKRAR